MGPSLGYTGPELVLLANPSGIFPDEGTLLQWAHLFKTGIRENGFAALRPHLFAKEPFWFRFVADEFSQFVRREDILQFIDSVRDDHVLEESASKMRGNVWLLWGEKDTLCRGHLCARLDEDDFGGA